MASGKPGDHPINDILDHGLGVFSPEADDLVREISELVPRDRLWDLVDWFSPPSIDEFTTQLRQIRDRLRRDAQDRGWEGIVAVQTSRSSGRAADGPPLSGRTVVPTGLWL